MAQVSNSTFRTLTDTLFATNATGGITAEDLRTHFDNISDSVPFKITGKTAAPTVNDDVDGSGGNGKFAVGDFWIDETNDAIYVCLDNTNVTAVWEQINDGNVDLSGNDTGDLAEGSNLYFTDERVDDRVAAMLAGGTNIGLSYDDGSNLLTINGPSTTAQISEGSNLYYTDERVDDRVNDLLVAGSNITLTYDDGAGTITIDASGGGASALDDLSDVDTTTAAPTDGQALIWDNANSVWIPGDVADSGAGASAPPYSGARTELTTTTSFSGNTIIDWDGTEFDEGGWWSVSNPSRLTVPAGVDKVELTLFAIAQSAEPAGTDFIIYLKKNGSTIYRMVMDNQFWGPPTFNSGDITVVEDDYFEMELWSTTTWDLDEAFTFMSIRALSGPAVSPVFNGFRAGITGNKVEAGSVLVDDIVFDDISNNGGFDTATAINVSGQYVVPSEFNNKYMNFATQLSFNAAETGKAMILVNNNIVAEIWHDSSFTWGAQTGNSSRDWRCRQGAI